MKAVSPRHAVLEELIALALRYVADDFRDVCTALAGLLVDGSRMAGAPAAVRASLRAGNLMRDRHFALLHRASSALERALRQELAQLAPQAPAASAPAQPLALVPYEEMDQRLTLGDAARPFDAEHADALAALNVRLAHLLERAVPRLNPFRPEVFIAALQEAWTGFDTEEGSAALLLPLVKPGRFFDLGRLYGALNVALERKGVLPGPLHRHRPGSGHDGRRTDALDGRLRRLLGADEGVPADAGQAGRVDGRLLAYLAGLPRAAAGAANAPSFHLGAVKRDAPAGSLSRADEGAIDLLAAVFDTVAGDAAIAPESRDLLHGLQLPVLKAALADKAFFFEDAHPARRLLDLLARMGWERSQRGDAQRDDPEYQAMRRSALHAARDSTEADEVTAAFAHAVRELEAALQVEEAAATAAIAAPIAAALKQEKTLAARRAARDAVVLRLGGGDVVAVVEAFLDDQWTDVLTVAYSVDDDKPGAVRHATQAMDDLLWSVRPKSDAQARKQLIARLPGLLATLNKWLDVIKWQDAERLRFFAELADCHASIVRAPLDIAPERRVELSVQAARAAARQRQARAAERGADDGVAGMDDAALAALARGAWLEFAAAEGPPRRVKLAWISPMRSLFIFSNGARQEAFSLAAGELARRLREGSATVLRHDGVVVRALAQALAVNDAAPGRDAA